MYRFYCILRTGVTIAFLAVLMPLLSLAAIITGVVTLGRSTSFITRRIGGLLGRLPLKVAGIKVHKKFHSPLPDEPVVFLFNHSSTLDLFIVLALGLPKIRFIAKREITRNPFFWILARFSGQIMIDRRDSRSAFQQLYDIRPIVRKKGISLGFAPEGTRSDDGEIGPFKPGAFHSAVALGYNILPMYIEGAWDLCPGKSLLIRPGKVTVHFLETIDTSSWTRQTLRQNMEQVRTVYLEFEKQHRIRT